MMTAQSITILGLDQDKIRSRLTLSPRHYAVEGSYNIML